MSDLKITDRMLENSKSNKSVGWLYLDPVQFLSLTVTDHNVYDWIKKELPHTKTIDQYNSYETLMPWLDVDMHTGKVIGHEGRHRAAACIKSGVKRLPVSICLRDHGYPVYYRQPNISDHESPKQLEKVFVTKKDVPRVLVGQFVHRSLLIDTNHLHEFWASHNAANITSNSAHNLDRVVKQMEDLIQGKELPGAHNCWQTVARFVRTHSLQTGNVLLFGDDNGNGALYVTHAILQDPNGAVLVDTNKSRGHYDPSKKGYWLNVEQDLNPLLKKIPVATLANPPVESSLNLRVLTTK